MTFLWPRVLWALVLLPVLLAAYALVRERRAGRRAALAAFGGAPAGMPPRAGTRRLTVGLLAVGLGLLVVAAARPQATIGELARRGTVIIALDTSTSMRATDLAPTRLEAARAAAAQFVRSAPPTIKVGLVGFGDGGLVMAQPSTDQGEVLAALDRLKPSGGTSLGQGIYAALRAISGGRLAITEEQLASGVDDLDIGHYGSAHVVLVSDGEDTSRLDPIPLARLAGAAGVRIDTVGLGSPGGTTLEVDGFTASTKLDEALLTEIAETTGGRYLGAPDAAALAGVYDGIDLELTSTPVLAEVGALLAAAALLLVVAGAGLSVVRTGRVI